MEDKRQVKFMGLVFDNHVSIGHLGATIFFIIGCSVWLTNIENRQTELRKDVEALRLRDVEIISMIKEERSETREDLKEIKEAIKEVSNKLDKKQDRN